MTPLTFTDCGWVHETAVARRTVWESDCGRYRIALSHYIVGATDSYADVFYAEHATESGWEIISRHRKRHTAESACQRHARREQRLRKPRPK